MYLNKKANKLLYAWPELETNLPKLSLSSPVE